MIKRSSLNLTKVLPYLLLIGGLIGIFCAGILTVEKIQLLEHPASRLGCDLNPVVACGPVINTDQASAFGFTNPLLGLVGFGVVAAIGAGLFAGATYKRWFWLGLEAGVIFGFGFVTWLQFETIFRIGALCPFCMVVWVVTIPIFWYTTLYNLQQGHLKTLAKYTKFAAFVRRHHGDILALWFLLLLSIILQHFWYYWKTIL